MSKKLPLFSLSLAIVSLGQPAWIPYFGPIAAAFGFAPIFLLLAEEPSSKKRFILGTVWFSLIQLFQLSWSLTHPFFYIYPVWVIFSALFGAQFGLLATLMTRARVLSFIAPFFFASFWVLMEWSRLFLFSGISWNPVGLALSTFLIPFQAGSILGLYGLSFLVIFTNVYAVQWLLSKKRLLLAPLLAVSLFPYAFGMAHLAIHSPKLKVDLEEGREIDVLLVQTGFSVEEVLGLHDPQSNLVYAYSKWKEILNILSRHEIRHPGTPVDLVVLPENVVPFGTYYPIYPFESVRKEFWTYFGEKGVRALPPLAEDHLATEYETSRGKIWMVNNAYWTQALSNLFKAEVIAGLEDTDFHEGQVKQMYCSASVFFPDGEPIERYDKRVLVPLGEYIPFEFLRNLLASYRVVGSHTAGSKAKVIRGRKASYGLSICYEETYGNIMRDNRLQGAELLVNLTNDYWYPNSRLMKQHFDHARLRAIEMGIPLVRSTNTGVTAAVDSLGNTLAILGDDETMESLSDALFVRVPRYHYTTIYTLLGDFPLMLFSFICSFLVLVTDKWRCRNRRKSSPVHRISSLK